MRKEIRSNLKTKLRRVTFRVNLKTRLEVNLRSNLEVILKTKLRINQLYQKLVIPRRKIRI